MSMYHYLVLLLIAYCQAESCINPEVSSSYYTNSDHKLMKSTVFVVEFEVKCKNKLENFPLYADVDGKQYPVTSSPETDNRQVSWTIPGKSQSRHYDVRFFDEEGYNNLRKAIRTGQDVSSIKPLFTVDVKHPGAFTNLWIKSELLALAGVGLLFYFVCRDRSAVIA